MPLLSKHVIVAVNAMGGNQAPQAIVAGAVIAARALPNIGVLLIGDEAVVRPLLTATGNLPPNISLRHASQVIDMCDAPGVAIRQKRDSSIAVGMRAVRDGDAQAIISAGNSGAMMAGAMLILKAQPGIDRPAIATLLPTKIGRMICWTLERLPIANRRIWCNSHIWAASTRRRYSTGLTRGSAC